MHTESAGLSRRQFLAGVSSLVAAPALCGAKEATEVAFFVVGDTHYLAERNKPETLNAVSAATNARLIDTLNRLPGTEIPKEAGGGTVLAPRGVVHAGDLIDSGDRSGGVYPKMQRTEWDAYEAGFGLTGGDGKLKYPVYEVHGNHDSPQGDGLVVERIAVRNKKRPGVGSVSKNGLHYSWDWGRVHFVCLGIVVGTVKAVSRKRRYAALDSLEFLTDDLAARVGKSGRPVVVTHHVDVARYATGCDPNSAASGREWDACDVRGYFDALKGYNVVAILYGHTHARNVFRWDGTAAKGKEGIPVFNVDNAGHFGFKEQGLFYCCLTEKELVVREYQTGDRWETARWTPQAWSVPVGS
jgi:cytolysin (calcineurin-like family phosphatase)